MKIEQITEDKVSAALHVANARHGQTLDRLRELVDMHMHRAAREGDTVEGMELVRDIESFIETERLR